MGFFLYFFIIAFLALRYIEGFFLVSVLVLLAFAATCFLITVTTWHYYDLARQADAAPDQR